MAECHKNDMDEDYCRVEIERLREALDFYANPVNWWWDSERNSWIWMGDNHPDMTARRVLARQSELAGEFTGKIETVKLYPKALTPEETSNDYEEARTAARMAYYELTEKLDGEE